MLDKKRDAKNKKIVDGVLNILGNNVDAYFLIAATEVDAAEGTCLNSGGAKGNGDLIVQALTQVMKQQPMLKEIMFQAVKDYFKSEETPTKESSREELDQALSSLLKSMRKFAEGLETS